MNFNISKLAILLTLILSGLAASLPASADRMGHGGGGHRGGVHHSGGHWIGGAGLGIGIVTGAIIGAELASPYYPYYPYNSYYSDYPYYPSTVIVQQPVTVEPQEYTEAIPESTPANIWYYCTSAKAYYPYVSSCPEPWHPVPATPPGR